MQNIRFIHRLHRFTQIPEPEGNLRDLRNLWISPIPKSGADTDPEFRRFLGIALKSAVEVVACAKIAFELKMISSEDCVRLCRSYDKLEAKLRTFRARLALGPRHKE